MHQKKINHYAQSPTAGFSTHRACVSVERSTHPDIYGRFQTNHSFFLADMLLTFFRCSGCLPLILRCGLYFITFMRTILTPFVMLNPVLLLKGGFFRNITSVTSTTRWPFFVPLCCGCFLLLEAFRVFSFVF